MRRAFISVLSLVVCILPAFADSFLTAQSFPKTFDDLSFDSKMDFMMDDYELFYPEYDENGFCVKNCAYPGLNIKQEQELSNRNTLAALEKSAAYEKQNKKLPVDTQSIVSNLAGSAYSCANRNPNILINQKVPRGEPLIGMHRISSPYGPRTIFGKQSYHYGIDYAVAEGTMVYSPADGRVIKVISAQQDAVCGNGLKIEHEDGVKTVYCHLSQVLVNKGDRVGAGCPIARTGNTGRSTGPHLHYGMRNANNDYIDPSPYTKRAY